MSLTYNAVVDVVKTFEASGKPVGARAILDVLKTGSLTTIQKYLLRYREEKVRLAPPDLPETVHRAILSFVDGEVKRGQSHLEKDREESQAALLDSLRTGEEQEVRIEELEGLVREREKRIEAVNDQLRHLEVRLGECQVREGREREEAHALREDLARAELRLEDVPRLREEAAALRTQLANEKEARVAAEKESAVSRALLAEKATSHNPSGRA